MERERNSLKGTSYSVPSPSHSDAEIYDNMSETSDSELCSLCCICFDQVCAIKVQDFGHQMCAQCTLALCCVATTSPTQQLLATLLQYVHFAEAILPNW